MPKKFSDFKKENQYQTSTMVKYLLGKKGFTVFYDDALPEDLGNNRCLGLIADLQDNSSMFSTKTKIVFKDCNNNEVFATQEGFSKEKDFKAAYSDALKKSMKSLNGFQHQYKKESEQSDEPITVSFKNDVKQLEPEKKKEESDGQAPNTNHKKTESVSNTERSKSIIDKNSDSIEKIGASSALYAQTTTNGYQLVDSTPKIIFKIFKSPNLDVYHAVNEETGARGLIYEHNGRWVFEHQEKRKISVQVLNIKF
ncbi:hypothetical protein [Costertonia aggregata]|uniref:Uncharacterized protein n=1 Tax=Costertonia aggregata TaxID=343403 RepID=A0A7H9ARQ6_9FLAO|nr:hypothetical protein [Costertonia aggregata]QLG46072.1 hypothetical protein HYG79_12185 [Costertonia aggregata]